MTKMNFLPFEKQIADLEERINQLRLSQEDSSLDISSEIELLSKKNDDLLRQIYADLTPWQITLVARHPARPYTLDYIDGIFDGFVELHGDRHFADDAAMVCGLARFEGTPCAVIGQQKGRDIKERTFRNFGMPKPEGYRKALRVMKLAEKFSLPVFCFVDTPGAFPGVGAEERGQSEAIGRNILEMLALKVPTIATVIGEGGSGGALAIAAADRVLMLQYATYSVISPEGCAAILWKTSDRAADAANALGITAQRLKELNLIDDIIPEPTGGAHRDVAATLANVKAALKSHLAALLTQERCWEARQERFLSIGQFEER